MEFKQCATENCHCPAEGETIYCDRCWTKRDMEWLRKSKQHKQSFDKEIIMAVKVNEYQLSYRSSNLCLLTIQAFPCLKTLGFQISDHIDGEDGDRVTVIVDRDAVKTIYKAIGRWLKTGRLGDQPLDYPGSSKAINQSEVERLYKEENHGS